MKTFSLLIIFVSMQLFAKPPAEAIQACMNKSVGDACSFSAKRGYQSGSCFQPHSKGALACKPNSRGGQQPVKSSTNSSNFKGIDFSPRGNGRTRMHTATSKRALDLTAATDSVGGHQVEIFERSDKRIIRASGTPKHDVGAFPNRGNPHSITKQDYEYSIPLTPKLNNHSTPLERASFGIAINGVVFDPGAAEWYKGERGSPWQYEALGGAISLGLDENHAHVQPNGAYHYHGLPTLLMRNIAANEPIGWAADGFAIYALNYNSEVQTSSWQLKQGYRTGSNAPSGRYDGTFVHDYVYQEGTGTLDECNGRIIVSDEYPNGTYAYFLTQDFPVIPRCHKGTPSRDFAKQR